jgi:hypothetical protein
MPSNILAFRYNGGWQQVPVQVDERVWTDLGIIYSNSPTKPPMPSLAYADPGTYCGADTNALFDADDELVFMAKDAGNRAPAGAGYPSGTLATNPVELTITDPRTNTTGYVYLFRGNGTLGQGAGSDYVKYQFTLLAGTYPDDYNTAAGPNPENSYISNAVYRTHFADRWICDEVNVYAGGASGADILDRHKNLFEPNNCVRTEETFCYGEGAFIANVDGPVRAIRSYIGANSGPWTQRDHLFYERREDKVTYLRVHKIPGIMDLYDYSTNATGMVYYDNLNTGGVTINGVPDSITTGSNYWEMVTGAQGSLLMALKVNTDVPALTNKSYYSDDTTPSITQCTGDAYEYGTSGLWIDQEIPNTDPTGGEANYLNANRIIYYASPTQTVATAGLRYQQAMSPLQVTAAGLAQCTAPGLLNPSFELGNVSGVATNWTGYRRTPNPTTVWSIQTASPPTGAGANYQQMANTSSTGGGGIRQTITGCTVSNTYEVSGWMRGNSLLYSTCTVKVSPTASTNWSSAIHLNPPQAYTGSTWTAFSGTVVATSTSMTLWLDGQTGGTGQNKAECFDAINVVCVGGAAQPPTITGQPSAQNVCPGANAVFSVTATGDPPLTYQWQKNQTNLSNGGHYSGVTTATLTITGADSSDVANYRCVVSNGGGNATSSEAALTLKTATGFTQQPAATNVCSGGTATFSVVATGDGTITYQWQKNQTNLSNGGHYSGVTTATLTITGADANDVANYRCVVTAGCGSSTSFQALLGLCTANALLNPSFELGNVGGVATNWTGYQRAPNPTTVWSIQTASPPAGAGTNYQQIANTSSTGGGGVRQNVSGCVVGCKYSIAGWYRGNSTLYSTCRVKVSPTASTSWSTAIDLNPPQSYTGSTWTAFSGTVTATGTNMTLWLDGQTGSTGLNKAECFDAVAVTCAP